MNPESLHVKYESDNSATAQAVAAKNHKFVGWYYDAAGNVPIVANDKLRPNGDTLILQKDNGWAPVTYYAKFETAVSDLTIRRDNGESGHVYVSTVDSNSTACVIYVTVTGNGTVTIKDLPLGIYTVTQQNGWSWRNNDPSKTAVHQNAAGMTVTFDNTCANDQWINGNSTSVKNERSRS